jgi:hypothetical protein
MTKIIGTVIATSMSGNIDPKPDTAKSEGKAKRAIGNSTSMPATIEPFISAMSRQG